MNSWVDEGERLVGVRFGSPELLERALTHASRRTSGEASNERLEFLGDALIGLVVSEHLFRELPDAHEGELTRIKSDVVSTRGLAEVAERLGLDQVVRSSRGVAGQAGLPPRVRAGAFEAVVAAIYLDQGLERARGFILEHLSRIIHRVLHHRHEPNHKSMLQQLAQRQFALTPHYELLAESGPEHGKRFQSRARVGPRTFQPAWGPSKREAEQLAARNALAELEGAP